MLKHDWNDCFIIQLYAIHGINPYVTIYEIITTCKLKII